MLCDGYLRHFNYSYFCNYDNLFILLHLFDNCSEIYPFEHKQLVDLLFIFLDESAMDVQRRPMFNGVY